jgi:replicative DNA helicase
VIGIDESLRRIAAPRSGAPAVDVWWDEITAIDAAGEQPVFDLAVPTHHSFVADDLIAHNTSFALGAAANVAVAAERPVLFFSMEMSKFELSRRLLSAEAQVDARSLTTGRLSESDWPKVAQAVGRLADAPLFIDDNPECTVMEMRAKARRIRATHGDLGLIVVDYLQLMSTGRNVESRQVEVSELSRGLKILARELEVPVMTLSQLNRQLEYRQDKRPMLADLRESGSIEQDADIVAFIYRDDYYNPESDQKGMAQVIVAKHRNGPTDKVDLVFIDHYAKFVNAVRS